METDFKATSDWQRYMRAVKRMQSGVAILNDPDDGSPKHIRVGINSAMVNADAFLHLLVDKGVCTVEEFQKYLADSAEREAARYEAFVQEKYGSNFKLGEAGIVSS
jgi:hypothetical protein